MKRILSYLLVLTTIFSCVMSVSTQASTQGSEIYEHVIADFEDGFDVSEVVKATNANLTWTDDDTHDSSKGALKFTNSKDFGTVAFPIKTVAGNTYHISAWIKVDETPAQGKNWGSFIFYNKVKGSTGTAYNQIAGVAKSANFEKDKWVLCTAKYTATGKGTYSGTQHDIEEEGRVEFRLADGTASAVMPVGGVMSYTIDDFYVLPEVQAEAGPYPELVTNGSFEGNIDGWQANATSVSSVEYISDGADAVGGALKAVKKTDNWFDVRTAEKIDLQYFKAYTLEYSARATDEKLAGAKTYAYIKPIATGTTHDVLPSSIEVHPVGSETLSTEWQRYTATIYLEYLTDTKVSTELYLRAGDRSYEEGMSFEIDNVSLKQAEPYRTDLSFMVQLALSDNSSDYVLTPQYTTSVGGYSYRVIKTTADGEECLKEGNGINDIIALPKNYFADGTTRIEYVGWDGFGNYTAFNSVRLVDLVKVSSAVQDSYVTLQTDNCFWSRGGDELFARFFFENADEDKDVYLIAAQYDENDVLIDAVMREVTAAEGEIFSEKLTATAKDEAVSARFFAFESKTSKPLTKAVPIDKVTSGQFIYADVDAPDGGDGSAENPFNSIADLQIGLDSVMKSSNTEPVYVVFAEGEYFTDEPIHLGVPENYKINGALSDKNVSDYYVQKPVTFTAAGADKAIISGGLHISGFTHWKDGIYRAAVPAGTQSRQLVVNGIKATRARTEEEPAGFENLDYKDDTFTNQGLTSTDTSYMTMAYPTEVELVFADNFRSMYIRPDSVTEESGKVHFEFSNESGGNAPAWMAMMTCGTPPTLPVYLENSLSFLDKEGEWYLDTHENYLYYKPRSFENIATADVVLPVTEKLMTFVGTPGTPINNVSVNNLEFAYSAWNTPTEKRHFHIWQNTAFWGTTTKGEYTYTGIKHIDGGILIDAAMEMKNINTVSIDNCDFNHLGATALKMTGAVQNSDVTGNEFYDISASAIALGDVAVKNVSGVTDNQINDTADILWDIRSPKAENLKIKNNTVSNNYIHKIGTDYFSSAALSTGYVVNTTIKNNELAEGPYSGMHLGWGWDSYTDIYTEGLLVEDNYIHDFMNWRLHDGAPIYTLGWTKNNGEKHSKVSGNYIANAKNRWGGIYFDEGSRYWQCYENVVDVTTAATSYSSYRQNMPVKTEDGTTVYLNHVPQQNKWFNVWTRSIQNIEAENNFSTTSVLTNKGTNVTVSGTTVCPGGQWNDDALAIISKSGVSSEYKSRFDFKDKYLRLPLVMEMTAGETQEIVAECRVLPKESPIDLSSCNVSVSSSNTNIVAVEGTTLKAKAEGMAWITVSVNAEDGNDTSAYYDEQTFCVYVK